MAAKRTDEQKRDAGKGLFSKEKGYPERHLKAFAHRLGLIPSFSTRGQRHLRARLGTHCVLTDDTRKG